MLIGYMRVSSETERQNLDMQRDALLAAGVDERHLHSDRASGAKDDRQGLAAALRDVRAGDCLIVWKLDRLGRSLPHLISTLEDLRARGVGFRSLTEAMDTSTPQGKLFFGLFAVLAEFERSLTAERVRCGIEAARRRGRIGGRPRSIDAEKLAAIQVALGGGMSKAAVCRTFGVSRSTLIDSLNRAAAA